MENILTKEIEYDYIEKAKNDPHYLELMIDSFAPLIRKIARPYKRDNIDDRDLFQQGVLGIIRTIQDFEPAQNKRFSTYARWWIKAYVRDFFLEQSRVFTISGSLTTQLNKVVEAEMEMEQELGRPVTLEEISQAQGISVERLSYLYKYRGQSRSIYEKITNGEDGHEAVTLYNLLPDNHCDDPSERLERVDSVEYLRSAIKKLTSVERTVIIQRYDLDGNGVRTLGQIGKLLNLSYERVRQIQERAEHTLKLIINR
jgi:RNA polymerase sigma factor (sigma-70 family)